MSVTFTVEVTHTSLCRLTRSFSSDASIADALCAKLDAAQSAADRGNLQTARAVTAAYEHQLSAQTGKAFSQSQADLLRRFAEAL